MIILPSQSQPTPNPFKRKFQSALTPSLIPLSVEWSQVISRNLAENTRNTQLSDGYLGIWSDFS
ncbi:hypothetical protein RPHASCH2410_CH10520 [Rhizobium phaseoli Ch24-10]|nr:hypothetical protein RPHASCH2410_CH10520 [Rhizobium phaseoli Ch24-10]